MGRKHGRQRVHLLLYLACIFIAVQAGVGCAHPSKSLEINSSLKNARRLMVQGDFQAALMENEKALSHPLQLSKDRLLFQRGWIYSHPLNPAPDYFKSVVYFQKVVDQYPRGSLSDAAESLIVILRQLSKKEEEKQILTGKIDWMENVLNEQRHAVYKFEGKSERLLADVEKLAVENGQLRGLLQKQHSEIDACRQELTDKNKTVEGLQSEVEELRSHMEKFKIIDLNIEKRKKNADAK